MKQKKIPMRRCIACYESRPKKELLRVVKAEQGITLDLTGKMNGRGAYICKNPSCFEKMAKGNKLSREFETDINAETYEALKKQFDAIAVSDEIMPGGGAIG